METMKPLLLGGAVVLACVAMSMELLLKLIMLFSILILVAYLGKMFGEHRKQPEKAAAQNGAHGYDALQLSGLAREVQVQDVLENTELMKKVLSSKAIFREEFSAHLKVLQTKFQAPKKQPQGKTLLYVCTTCQYSLNESVEGGQEDKILDIEDVVQGAQGPPVGRESTPFVEVVSGDPSMSVDLLEIRQRHPQTSDPKTKKKKEKSKDPDAMTTGKILHRKVLEELAGSGIESEIEVVPSGCLSTCYRSNVVSFSCPGRYSYQFGDLNHRDAAPEIVEFAKIYLAEPEGFTKTKMRPQKLKESLLSRIPPYPFEIPQAQTQGASSQQ